MGIKLRSSSFCYLHFTNWAISLADSKFSTWPLGPTCAVLNLPPTRYFPLTFYTFGSHWYRFLLLHIVWAFINCCITLCCPYTPVHKAIHWSMVSLQRTNHICPSLCWKVGCPDLAQATTASAGLWGLLPWAVQETLFYSDPPWPLALTLLLPPLF